MEREVHPLDLHVVLVLEFLNTHGTEIAPGSDVVGENLHRDGFGHDASSGLLSSEFSDRPSPPRLCQGLRIRRRSARCPPRATASTTSRAPYSMTLSARSRTLRGIVSWSALAVRRFTTVSNFSVCCLGFSAAFAPLKTLSTRRAEGFRHQESRRRSRAG